ncbi:hypothetical protein B7486_20050 [cyanobacterium TDX16]|nr:hypothetical protein B7486_20050 [cyanobacterium TDX16]
MVCNSRSGCDYKRCGRIDRIGCVILRNRDHTHVPGGRSPEPLDMSSMLSLYLPELLIVAWVLSLFYRTDRRLRRIESELEQLKDTRL